MFLACTAVCLRYQNHNTYSFDWRHWKSYNHRRQHWKAEMAILSDDCLFCICLNCLHGWIKRFLINVIILVSFFILINNSILVAYAVVILLLHTVAVDIILFSTITAIIQICSSFPWVLKYFLRVLWSSWYLWGSLHFFNKMDPC